MAYRQIQQYNNSKKKKMHVLLYNTVRTKKDVFFGLSKNATVLLVR